MATTGIAHAAPVDLSFDTVRYAVNVQASAWTRVRAACCGAGGARAGAHTRLDAADGGEDGLDHGAPKEILHGITGYVEAGQCLAIMGPSGAGKSSLMDVLAGRQKRGTVDGNIYVNGRPPPANYQRLAGYVMQDDVLIGTLTVTETLMYSHALRMPKEVHIRDGAATVASILQVRVRHTLMGPQGCWVRKAAGPDCRTNRDDTCRDCSTPFPPSLSRPPCPPILAHQSALALPTHPPALPPLSYLALFDALRRS